MANCQPPVSRLWEANSENRRGISVTCMQFRGACLIRATYQAHLLASAYRREREWIRLWLAIKQIKQTQCQHTKPALAWCLHGPCSSWSNLHEGRRAQQRWRWSSSHQRMRTNYLHCIMVSRFLFLYV